MIAKWLMRRIWRGAADNRAAQFDFLRERAYKRSARFTP